MHFKLAKVHLEATNLKTAQEWEKTKKNLANKQTNKKAPNKKPKTYEEKKKVQEITLKFH